MGNARDEAGNLTCRNKVCVHARSAGATDQDEWLVRQCMQVERALTPGSIARQGMRRRQGHQQRLLEKFVAADLGHTEHWRSHQREVERRLQDCPRQRPCIAIAETQPDARIHCPMGRNHLGRHAAHRGRAREADCQGAIKTRGRLGGAVFCALCLGENAPCLLEKHGASRRGLYTLPTAIEQREPELALQIAQLLTERRLLHPQPCRCASDGSLFRNGDDVAKVPQFHPSLYSRDMKMILNKYLSYG